jgi:hypothetical protein
MSSRHKPQEASWTMSGTLQPAHVKLLFKNRKHHLNLKEVEPIHKISVKKITVLYITEVLSNLFQHYHFTYLHVHNMSKSIRTIILTLNHINII